MSNSVIHSILEPFRSGFNICYVDGDLSDFRLKEDGKMQKIETLLANQLYKEFDAVMIQYSLASGVYFVQGTLSANESSLVNNFLQQFKQREAESPYEEFLQVIRQLFVQIKSSHELKFDDGRPMKIAFLFRYTDHLLPNIDPAIQEPHHLIALELFDMLVNSLDLRNSSHYIILNGKGAIDRNLKNNLHNFTLPYPDGNEKAQFLKAATELYQNASLEEGLAPEQVVYLTKNTPNRSLELIIRASHYQRKQVSYHQISQKREEDILELSEGTLSPINPERIMNELCGINIQKPMELLLKVVDGLKKQDSRMPSNIILVGPKSSGKSDLAILAAKRSQIPSYRLNSPKSKWVGETERLARKMFDLLSYTFTPSIGIIDELELQFPLDRNKNYQDSGASEAVTGILQEVLADRSRNGKCILIGTSNKPTMGASMFERFDLVLPVLMPLREDLPEIICALAKTIEPGWSERPDSHNMQEAANIFYSKHGSPRNILAAFKRAVTYHNGKFNTDIVLWSARNMRTQANYLTAIYCDLLAIKLSGNELLPWFDVDDYPFPGHILEIMSGGEVDEVKLNHRLQELESYARV